MHGWLEERHHAWVLQSGDQHSPPLPPLQIKNLLVVAQAFREGQELIYTQPETECWHKQATWSCEFNCAEGEAGAQKKGCRRVRLVLLIPFAKMKAAGAALEKLLEAHE